MASNIPTDGTDSGLVRLVVEPSTNSEWPMCDGLATNSEWPMCDGMPRDKVDADLTTCRELLEELIKINNRPPGQYRFLFPGVSDAVASIYWNILIAMERRFAIEDYFTNPELRRIVKAIDNRDYVKDAYPDTDVGWHGLMLDSGIFIAIARLKKQFDNPLLVSVVRVCSALTIPMPKHLYYLTFKFENGTEQVVSYRSGDELLIPVPA